MTRSTLQDQAPAPDSEEVGLDLQRYLEVLRRRIWIIAAVVAVGVTLAVLYTMRQPRIYQATAKVIVDPQPPQVFGDQVQEVIQLGTGSYWANQEYYNTQIDILQSYDLAELTVSQNGLYNRLVPPEGDQAELTEEERKEAAAYKLWGTLSASQNRESRVVNIRVRNVDAELAADLANTHVKTYTAYTLGLRTEGSGDVSKFLSTELDAAEQRLREAEQELHQYKRDNDILSVSLEDKQSMLAADLARYTAAHGDARIKRIELGSVRQRAQNLQGEDVLESPVFALASNSATVETMKEQYLTEKQRFLELQQELGPRHPDFIAQQNKVDELYQGIQREARRAMRELDERYQAAVATESQFKAEVERLKKEAFELGPKTIVYNRLARKQQSEEQAYNLVLGRLRTTDLSGRNQQTNIREHTKARGGVLVSPRVKLNIAVGLMLSLMLGVGLAFLLDYLDRTVKSAEDVERAVGAPLLGVIPVIEEVANPDTVAAMRERDLWVFNNPKSRAAECCRSIRTNILFSSADRKMSTITVSSPRPQEGKTTSTIYMGTTMAQSGQRVLLIDTDMRRPRLHKSLGVSRAQGLTSVLLGQATLDDVIKTTDIPNLWVLPCGPQPPNPAELLLTNRFKEVLEELKGRYDRILLDSPPVLAVTDAVVLARISDGVIMVAQAGKTAIDDVAQAGRQFHDVDAPVLGMILNDMDISDKRYGYSYYAYGYGEEKAEGA